MRDDVHKLIELSVALRKLDIGFREPPVLLLQLGFQPAVDRDVLSHEPSVGNRALARGHDLADQPHVDLVAA